MINLNWKQRLIVAALKRFQSYGKTKFTLDELMPHVYGAATAPGAEEPANPRVALASGLRTFGFKLASEKGYSLRRVSKVGRGHTAEYAFKGDFAKLLEENSK